MQYSSHLTPADRFHASYRKDAKTGCWVWPNANGTGYGRLRVSGRSTLAHRFSYEIHIGPVPDGMLVCHHCHNRRCVNPHHLFVGSDADKVRYMFKEGRNKVGAPHGTSKLTVEQVNEIKTRAKRGVDYARKFGVLPNTIYYIWSGRTWADPHRSPHLKKRA